MSPRYAATADAREGVEVFSLADGAAAVAEIAPSLGNNCFAFRVGDDVLEPVSFAEFRQRPTSYGIPILFPFPNRIRDGRFTFQGAEHTVNPPRHGFVRDKPWTVEGHGASDAEGAWLASSFDAAAYTEQILGQFPFPFRLEVTYRLKDGILTMSTRAHNTGEREMPVGFGIHPYFRKPAEGRVTVPAAQRWELAESLPTGALLPVEGSYDLRGGQSLEGLQLDDIFTGVAADEGGIARCALVDETSGGSTIIEFSARQFPHVVVYTPPAPRQAICVEPNTCPTDAFNLASRGVESNLIALGAGRLIEFDLSIYTRPSEQAFSRT